MIHLIARERARKGRRTRSRAHHRDTKARRRRGRVGQRATGDTEGTEQSTSRRHRDLERSSGEDVTSRRLLRRLQFHRAVPLAVFATAPQGAGPHAVGRIALRSGRVKARVQLHAADLVCSTCPHIPVSAVSSAASCREVRAHCVVPPRSSPCLRLRGALLRALRPLTRSSRKDRLHASASP